MGGGDAACGGGGVPGVVRMRGQVWVGGGLGTTAPMFTLLRSQLVTNNCDISGFRLPPLARTLSSRLAAAKYIICSWWWRPRSARCAAGRALPRQPSTATAWRCSR